MSIAPTTNYMSHDFIDAWMESRTEQTYGDMRDAMDASGHRTDAEKALNDIKSDLANIKNNGGNTTTAFEDKVNEAISEYSDVPGFADSLRDLSQTLGDAHVSSTNGTDDSTTVISGGGDGIQLDGSKIDGWSTSISDCVDYLGKQDQLGTINLNQLNSQINQTENIASAIKDSRSKTAESIINRIG
jgi:hypothetical protein